MVAQEALLLYKFPVTAAVSGLSDQQNIAGMVMIYITIILPSSAGLSRACY